MSAAPAVMEQFIERIQQFPVLYNPNHVDYVKKSVKDAIYQQLAEEMNYKDGNEVKYTWLKLRNCHRDALRRKDCKNKSTTAKPWKYEQEMSFLKKFMVCRAAIESVEDTSPDLSEASYVDEKSFKTVYIGAQETLELTENSCTGFENCHDSSVPNEMRIRKIMKKEDEFPCDPVKQEPLRGRPRKRPYTDMNNDELYHFYMSMYNITKNLPISRQIKIKKQIFNIVIEEQEQDSSDALTYDLQNSCCASDDDA